MREILVFDILQYCKLLTFVKQNEISFKLLMLKLKTDWGAVEQMLDRGRLWTLSRSLFSANFLINMGRQMPYSSSFVKIPEEGIETPRFGGCS